MPVLPFKERRRRTPLLLDDSNPTQEPRLPYGKRESDRDKLRIQRWLELAKTALRSRKKPA